MREGAPAVPFGSVVGAMIEPVQWLATPYTVDAKNQDAGPAVS